MVWIGNDGTGIFLSDTYAYWYELQHHTKVTNTIFEIIYAQIWSRYSGHYEGLAHLFVE